MSRIVIAGPAHPLRGGGMATFNERLARAFMDEGHEVILYTFSLQYPSLLFPGKSQYSEEPAPLDLDIRVRINSINPLNWISCGKELKQLQPDLLIIRYWLPFMSPALGSIARIVKKNRHTRVVALTDNIIPHERRTGDSLLTRYFLKSVHAFVYMSEAVGNDLQGFGIEKQFSQFCPHPLYDNFGAAVPKQEARRQLRLDPDEAIVLFFGFIRPYKGLDLLMKALNDPRLKDIGLRLLVAGEFYEDEKPYKDLEARLDLNERVIWHSHFIASDQVRLYFSAANLVAQTYRNATQSGVTQVAYHFDKPMLVTRVGGLAEMVQHNRGGYAVDPEPDAIADALYDYFVNKREGDFSESVKQFKKQFSWHSMTRSLFKAAGMVKSQTS